MRRLAAVLIIVAIFVLTQCSDDNPVDEGGFVADPAKADSIASVGFTNLGDTLQALGDRSFDALRNVRFDDIRDEFNAALSFEPGNPIAHLGLAIVEILELNYNADIWALVDSVDSWLDGKSITLPGSERNRHRTLLGRQFSLLVHVPFAMNVGFAASFPSNVTLSEIQRIIQDTAMPALGRSINHLATAEADIDAAVRILIDDNGVQEYVKIDLGEIFLFDASVHALRAAFGMAIAYDADLFGPDGTYDWIDDVEYRDSHRDSPPCCVVQLAPGTPFDELQHLCQGDPREVAEIDSILARVLHHNFTQRFPFLRLRDNGQSMQAARQDVLATMSKLFASADFIRNIRQGENEENVIKLTDLTDLDADLPGPDVPNFAKDFDRVEDIFDFVRDLFSGPVSFEEELGPDDVLFSWTMDLSAWFDPPTPDMKTLLPHHQWNVPVGNWIDETVRFDSDYDNGGGDWPTEALIDGVCVPDTFQNIGIVSWYTVDHSLDLSGFIELLDNNGNVINLETARFPYFEDYTMGGLFPDMAQRSRWMTLMIIIDP